jgi:hypothetical protein
MRDAAALLALNGGYLAIGVGFLLTARVGLCRVRSVDFALLAYACGVTTLGIVAAQLALVDLVPGLVGTWLIGLVALATGVIRQRRHGARGERDAEAERWSSPDIVAAAVSCATVGLALVTFSRLPLKSWDGWAIWATKAHALYTWGGVSSPALRSATYSRTHLDYPLLLPSLEANGLRALGRFDGTLVHLGLAFVLAAFAAGLLVLLRGATPPAVRAVVVVGAVASPTVMTRLASNYADVPLAFFVALGVVSIVLWTKRGDDGLLVLAALFLGAAALTKSEGAIFAAVAFGAAALFAPAVRRARLRVLASAAGAFIVVLPWRIFAATHHLTNSDYSVGNSIDPGFLASRVNRVPVAVSSLLTDVFTQWELLWIAPALAVAAAVSARRLRLTGVLAVWTLASFAALVLIYWISAWPIRQHLDVSADRVVGSIVLTAFCVSAVIIGDLREALTPERGP